MCPKITGAASEPKKDKKGKIIDPVSSMIIPLQKRCTDPNCPFAHNAIELDLVTNEVMATSLQKQIKKKAQVDVDLKQGPTKPQGLLEGLVKTGVQNAKQSPKKNDLQSPKKEDKFII